MTTCPHDDIRFCPLYVAAHDPVAVRFCCDDGRLDEGGCGVDRAMNYAARLARLRAAHPRLVALCEFNAEIERARRQRARNMRQAGIQ